MPLPSRPEGYFDKVNYVIDAWMSPCQAPWYVYIETLKPALLAGFITLLTFGWDDVFRGWARPKNLGKRRTGKRKGKFSRAIPRFPEVGEAIGRQLPAGERIQRWSDPNVTKHLWRIDGHVQRAMFWWLIADITIDLAVNWTSQLYAVQWCAGLLSGGFSARRFGLSFIGAGHDVKIFYDMIEYSNLPFTWDGQVAFTGAVGGTIGATIDVFGALISGPTGPYTFMIRDRESGRVYAQIQKQRFGPVGPVREVLLVHVPPERWIQFRFISGIESHWIGEGVAFGGARGP